MTKMRMIEASWGYRVRLDTAEIILHGDRYPIGHLTLYGTGVEVNAPDPHRMIIAVIPDKHKIAVIEMWNDLNALTPAQYPYQLYMKGHLPREDGS